MPGSELLIEFSVRQHRLLEALERLHRFAEDASQSAHLSLQPALKRLGKLQKHFKDELGRFSQWAASSKVQHLAVAPHLTKVAGQAQQLVQSLTLRFRETNPQEWKLSLAQLGPGLAQLKVELKSIDLQSHFAHIADAILIDRLEGLGRPQVIQWPRKIFHVLAGLLIVSIYLFIPVTFSAKMIVFGCFTSIAIVCDVSRLLWPKFNAQVVKDLQKYMRQREVNRLNSMTFYAFSTFLVCLLFPKAVAIIAVLFLGIGDAAASLVGVKWGRHRFGRRFSLEGSLAFFTSCALLSLLYPVLNPGFHGPLWLFALLGGLIGALSERCIPRLDDNLVIPLFSATLLQILLSFF